MKKANLNLQVIENIYFRKNDLLTKIILLFTIFSAVFLQAQFSGNQVYNKKDDTRNISNGNQNSNFSISDTNLTINVNILLNEIADHYKITLGVSEEAGTVKNSLDKINSRIRNFTSKLTSMGIKKEDVFVDFISQNKIYDYTIDENKRIATQKTVGFEIKKNIIVEITDYSQIEKIISEASEYQIFDIIKVDYINTDIEKIKGKLMDAAYEILNKKKNDYQKKYSLSYIGEPKGSENFSFVFPKSQYQEYTAFESSEVENPYYNNNNYIKKEERKSKTFYYEGLDYSGFDKIINSANPTIGIQYVMSITITYDIKRGI